ncbi:poly(A) RNA polymerase gld-2 homolog A-like [Mya arenaria]|uniref:poly(A) RNA polymerase gld-2 homolog A-like n=1 Tax=Mya arenaria TaxID=6604 RepID=UPI0022E01813|nr:poly(A) RNA polymerase gld-2 homolog A-like [Mya arenaria]XP_052797072.1 poly(A) RNA polymerase gld-2 homolog A-like [Mya arenaria]
MYNQGPSRGGNFQPYSHVVPTQFLFQNQQPQMGVGMPYSGQLPYQQPLNQGYSAGIVQWNNAPSMNFHGMGSGYGSSSSAGPSRTRSSPRVYPVPSSTRPRDQYSGMPGTSRSHNATKHIRNTTRLRPNPLVSTPLKRGHVGGEKERKDEPDMKKKRVVDKLRATLPPASKNDTNANITAEIWKYFERNKQSDSMYERKVDLRNALYAVFKEVFPYSGLYMVGSSMSGFATQTSDMDLCLMVTAQQIEGKKEAVEILIAIQNALRRSKFVQQSQVIRAKVPILKFKDSLRSIECDLNINNPVGIRNTHLLRYYASMDWRVRPLVLFVKKWARFHDINDASKQTVSSYSLCLMVLHYLQAGCKPPVLDSVQKLYPDLFNFGDDVRNLQMNVKIEFKSENTDSLGDLFLGFLKYYTHEFDFESDVASVRQGIRLPVHLVKTWTRPAELTMWKCLKVEEPFDKSNTARSCYDEATFARVQRVIARSYRTLCVKRDVNALLSSPF